MSLPYGSVEKEFPGLRRRPPIGHFKLGELGGVTAVVPVIENRVGMGGIADHRVGIHIDDVRCFKEHIVSGVCDEDVDLDVIRRMDSDLSQNPFCSCRNPAWSDEG